MFTHVYCIEPEICVPEIFNIVRVIVYFRQICSDLKLQLPCLGLRNVKILINHGVQNTLIKSYVVNYELFHT